MHRESTAQFATHLVPRHCERCGEAFVTTADNLRRGWGRYCGQSCTASARNRRVSYASRTYSERKFWGRIEKSDSCWMWKGAPHTGYGRVRYQGKDYQAHRLAYILTFGAIADDLMVCHNCDRNYPVGDISYRLCCRPDHLFLGTGADNVRDMVSKGRQASGARNSHALYPERTPRGERHGMARYTDATIERIIRDFAEGSYKQADLARKYGVSPTHISDILRGKSRVGSYPHQLET